MGIIALNPLDKLNANLAREKRIFTVGLLAPAPARVAENVDVRRPKRHAIPPFGIAVVRVGVIVEFRAAFDADDRAFLMKQLRIPRSSSANRLGTNRRNAVVGDAVQRFVPIIVSPQTEARNSR